MIAGVDPHPSGAIDLGADRELRGPMCTRHAWCELTADHHDVVPCSIKPRTEHAPEDFGPEASKRRRY